MKLPWPSSLPQLRQRRATVLLPLLFLIFIVPLALRYHRGVSSTTPANTTYSVTPDGLDDDDHGRILQSRPPPEGKGAPPPAKVIYTLAHALKMARAGDTILLGNGVYNVRLVSSRSGVKGRPITIVGGPKAVIKAPSDPIEINHSWITIQVSNTEDWTCRIDLVYRSVGHSSIYHHVYRRVSDRSASQACLEVACGDRERYALLTN